MFLWPWCSQGEGWLRDGLMLTGHFGHMAKECRFTQFEAGGLPRRASGVRIVPTVWSHEGAPNSLTALYMYIFLYLPTSFSEIQIISSSSSKTGCKAAAKQDIVQIIMLILAGGQMLLLWERHSKSLPKNGKLMWRPVVIGYRYGPWQRFPIDSLMIQGSGVTLLCCTDSSVPLLCLASTLLITAKMISKLWHH